MPTHKTVSVDDETIAAVVHTPKKEPDETVVFAHGFGSDKEGRYSRRAQVAADEGFKAVRFDFRGNHESSRVFEEANLTTRIEDLQAVMDAVNDDRFFVYGASFGGLVTLHTAARDDRIKALAVRAPVTYLDVLSDFVEAVEKHGEYEHIPGKTIDQRFVDDLKEYNTADIIDKITVPSLFLHGLDDTVVPIETVDQFYKAVSCTKDFIRFTGQGHRFDDYADCRAVMRSLQWFRESRATHHIPE